MLVNGARRLRSTKFDGRLVTFVIFSPITLRGIVLVPAKLTVALEESAIELPVATLPPRVGLWKHHSWNERTAPLAPRVKDKDKDGHHEKVA
jgi:hypothetical protein